MYDEKRAIERAQRCLDCPNPPCRRACPLSNRIPEFLSKVKEGEIDEAMRIILRENPLPGITGYVCPSFCQSSCVLAKNGSPVQVGEVEKFVSGNSSVGPKFDARETGKRVAIIGSGPAGLAGGYFLRRAGHEAMIYEKSPVVGGMMALGIPDFRLPRKVLQREVGRIRGLGVKIRTDSSVEYINELFEEGYNAVLSAIGSHKPKSMNIAGENLEGVRHAIPFLRRTNLGENITLGDKTAIIGGGDAAIDAARTTAPIRPKIPASKAPLRTPPALVPTTGANAVETLLARGLRVKTSYGGPNPPDGEHTYRFRLYALDSELDPPGAAAKGDVEEAMEGEILEEAELTGTYAP